MVDICNMARRTLKISGPSSRHNMVSRGQIQYCRSLVDRICMMRKMQNIRSCSMENMLGKHEGRGP